MIYDLNFLNKEDIIIDEYVEKDDELDKRILDLKNAHAVGRIYLNGANEIILDVTFSGTMYLEDSISLEPIPHDFTINIEENMEEIKENYQESIKMNKNTLDLKSILWQNIVLEVPISLTLVTDANIKGNGWELQSNGLKEDIDPRLKKLEDLLKGDD